MNLLTNHETVSKKSLSCISFTENSYIFRFIFRCVLQFPRWTTLRVRKRISRNSRDLGAMLE